MKHGRYKIADCVFELNSFYERIHIECESYRTGERPDYKIEICRDDIEYEREQAILFDERKKHDEKKYSDSYLEMLAVHRKLSDFLLKCDTLLFHGSAIAVDNQAYLFTARSGTGKSTHTRLWEKKFGSRAVMINDDKPYLKISPEGIVVYGSPWAGKSNLHSNVAIPLRALCILQRGQENVIRKIEPRDAMAAVFVESYRPEEETLMELSFSLTAELVRQAKIFELQCTMSQDAVETAWRGMKP